ncbi:PIN domain-containing protein [Streptomyces sp. NPDC101152]|uniref:PIN domain-containing protein n=1 Tax=Streptomyces sp. NPDC101152 TaxID=3366116 RepID=UPI0037FFD8F1
MEYLDWTSDAVRMLRGQIRATDIDRLVLTRRQAALLDGVGRLNSPEHEKLVNNLVSLELDERVQAFGAAIQQLADLTQRWRPSLRLLVPDSSLFIQHPAKFEETDFAALLGGGPEPVHVLVPMAVIDELDALKETKKPNARWRAGYTLAVIDRLLQDFSPGRLRPVAMRPGSDNPPRGEVTLEILFDPPGHTRLPNSDDEIIDRAVVAQALAGTPVTLVTYDTGQSTRGRAAGLKVNKLRNDAGTGPEPVNS